MPVQTPTIQIRGFCVAWLLGFGALLSLNLAAAALRYGLGYDQAMGW